MAKFFKHVGKHNSKNVIIIEKSIPGESHMCLVVYGDIIPSRYREDISAVLNSAEGQAEKEFGLILNRKVGSDGRSILQTLAMEGLLKKAPTNQVIVTPNSSSSMRLDELNTLLHRAGEGKAAIDKLEALDRESGFKDTRKNPPVIAPVVSAPDVLDDATLASQYKAQSIKMKKEAEALLAEAANLESMAENLVPTKKVAKRGRASKATA